MPQIREPKPSACWHCDFGSGMRGCDRCGKCDGTGSIFRFGGRHFPNTEQGWHEAMNLVVGAYNAA